MAKELPPIGSRIHAAGFPSGGGFSLVEGVLSGLRAQGNVRLITTALTVPGFSGGPVLNDAGEVIGMSVTVRRDGTAQSFSVPLHELQNLRERMRFVRNATETGA